MHVTLMVYTDISGTDKVSRVCSEEHVHVHVHAGSGTTSQKAHLEQSPCLWRAPRFPATAAALQPSSTY